MAIVTVLLAAVRLLRALVVPALLVASLVLNLLIMLSATVFNMAASVVGGLTGGRSVVASQTRELAETSAQLRAERTANRELREEVARQSAELAAERQVAREVRGELAEASSSLASHRTALATERQAVREVRGQLTETSSALAASGAELSAERAAIRETRSQLVEMSGDLATSRMARQQVQEAVTDVTERISRRSARSATRELAAMPAESIPVWGTAIIVGATAMEIADLCQTLVDMTELRRAFDASAAPSDEQLTVCALKVPSRSEVWAMASAAPERAWTAAADAMPEAGDLRGLDPRAVDWSAVGAGMVEGGKSATDSARAWMRRKGGQLGNWWNN